MAKKRMLSVDVTETDLFYSLPVEVQALYMHLAMNTDDDGFVSRAVGITRNMGADDACLKRLVDDGYLMAFSKRRVYLVRHHWLNNNFEGDRYKPTVFQEELNLVEKGKTKVYEWKGMGTDREDNRVQSGHNPGTESGEMGTGCATAVQMGDTQPNGTQQNVTQNNVAQRNNEACEADNEGTNEGIDERTMERLRAVASEEEADAIAANFPGRVIRTELEIYEMLVRNGSMPVNRRFPGWFIEKQSRQTGGRA